MSTFHDKTAEYLNQVKEFESKGDFDNAIRIANIAISYIEGFTSRENNLMYDLYYSNYLAIWKLKRSLLETNKKIDPINSETSATLNNLTARVKKLEERFDKLDSFK